MQYQLKRSRRSHNIRIEITPQAKVLVTAPFFLPQLLVEKFVQEKALWIEKSLRKIKQRQSSLGSDQLYIFDRLYQIKLNDQANSTTIHARGNILYQQNLSPRSKSARQQQLERFLKNTIHKYLLSRTQQLAKKMAVNYSRISLRGQKSRWGSCSSRGNLNFNWRLVHYPVPVVDYVIIHELAHRLELNHSRRFWTIVSQFDPDYKQHRKALEQRRYL